MSDPSAPGTDAPAVTLPRVNVAFIGHHGDGKTTLVAALLADLAERPGCQATALTVAELDRPDNPQWRQHYEKHGAVTVEPRKLVARSTRRVLGIVDCPGLRSRLKCTAWAVGGSTAVVLVVSARHGLRAQTREHLRVAAALGIDSVVVFLNKCDEVGDGDVDEPTDGAKADGAIDAELRIDTVESELRELLHDCGFDGDETTVLRGAAAPALAGDPLWRGTVSALVAALDDESRVRVPTPDAAGAVRYAIDRVATWPNDPRLLLVTGVVERGAVKRGARLASVGIQAPLAIVARSVEVDGRPVERAVAGQHAGILIAPGDRDADQRLNRSTVRRGHTIVEPARAHPRAAFCARITILPQLDGGRHTPIVTGHCVHVLLGTMAFPARITLLDGLRVLEPGARGRAMFELPQELQLERGRTFSFRDGTDGFQRAHGGPPVWAGTAGRGEITRIGKPSAEERMMLAATVPGDAPG